ncbi:formamidopyrimidine-DNA glycosylase [Pyrus ussuriensis x Pyrus communis]|uniref:Formamidopyrimidine-DNA glycosylase n=1 Tax=Pyrus ussuriensis x Pyrus communis TaxID=2448454 RepID=A0A5N5GCJ6_9ROSA|nr:formamidopyrimidine-DNA glycosylase [Pyrus ussuriensis x Pyrus communis]
MPELPEVEAARRAVEEHCVGKKITKALIADDSKVIDGVSRADFEASLLGKTIVSAHRKGKNMWLCLDSPPFPSFQFGMAGAVYIKGVAVTKYKRSAVKDTDEWPSKYSKFFVELDDGLEFSFTDKRRFARVRLLKDPTSVPPISELGPDALLEPMTVDELFECFSKKKIAIKTLLLDQSVISGIGNWVADEVLYQARIHPEQGAASLSKENCAALHKSIKEVLEKSLEVGADSSQFPSDWIFHSREKKPGKAFVDGKKIEFITVGSRTSAFVPELQKLSGPQASKAATKQANQKKGRGDVVNDDVDEAASDEEANENEKSKKGRKPKGQGKRASAKRKSKESDDEDKDSDDDADDNDDHQDEDQKKKSRKGVNSKQSKAEKTSKAKVQTSQSGKKLKKGK